LDGISFRAEGGRVLALMGENGAGKSTLLKILSGDLTADEGEVRTDGVKREFRSPRDAIGAGISVIYQERQLIPALSVMENIFAGDLPKTKAGFIDLKKLKTDALKIIERFALPLAPETAVSRLSVAHQQMVEIMKAYRRGGDIICFDEPTASLGEAETSVLFDIIRQLRDDGKIVIYVSHRIAEIFQISDDIIVFKDGKLAARLPADGTTERELIRAMVGRDIGDTYSQLSRNEEYGETVLEVKDVCTKKVKNVSFTLRKGEIIGFSGLVGAGRTEAMLALFGEDKIISGEIRLDGKPVRFKSPADAVEAGIALCPEDRKEQGLVLYRSITDNVSIPALSKLTEGLFIRRKREKKLAADAVERYSVKTPGIDKVVVELSGGNQQKVILGRWTSECINPKVLILDEPTKGIDVGTKAEIYQTVCDFAKSGMGVIFISSELPEVIGISDKIYVMREGEIVGCADRRDATEEKILAASMPCYCSDT
jgi:ABC-type sugar transport system ATPase subunit